MKFTVNQPKLNEAVSIVFRAVPSKSPVTALEGIKMYLSENSLELTGFDLDMGIQTVIEVKSDNTGEFMVNSKLFSDIVKKLPVEDIDIEIDDKLKMTIKGGDAEFTILAFSADDYPSIPDVDRSDSFAISQAMLKNMINQTKFAVATSDNKPILTGELFEIQDGYFNLVAIDGFRLAVRTEAAGSDDRRKFVVKEKTLSEVSKLLKDEDKPVTMYLSKKHIIFDINGCMVISRLLEGEFHNYRSSIPKSHSTEVILNTKDILTSLDRCSSLIDDQAKAPVRCIFENGNVNVSCSTSSGKFNGDFAAQITGAKVEIGFNCRYLMDAINATESDKVKILLNGGLSPMKIVPTDGDSYTFLVLPVRLKSE